MISVFDIETNGHLNSLDKIHSLVIRTSDGELYSFSTNDIPKGIEILSRSQVLVGHNILCFDLPALQKVYGFKWEGQVFDTLNLSRLIFTDLLERDFQNRNLPKKLYGRHSLEAWGHRLGVLKGEFGKQTDWSEWTEEMQLYCEQDVKVTELLYNKLKETNYSQRAIDLEHEFQKIIHIQETNGILFDEEKAKNLAAEVETEIEAVRRSLSEHLPRVVKRGILRVPKVSNRKMGTTKGCAYTKLTINKFNPGSRTQIVDFFKSKYSWKPTVLTDKGNPKLDEEVFNELPFKEAGLFTEYFERQKILGFVRDGKGAWLKHVNNGRIYGRVITNGAVTGRCTHSSPNLAQVPSARKYKGKECRELFHSGLGWMIGADASGLELRMLAHYLAKFDGGTYARQLLEGDIHSANQQAAGLETRDQAKTFIYAFCYGAGDAKLGAICSGIKDDTHNRHIGKNLRTRFLSKVRGLNSLIQDVQYKARVNKNLTGLDGRKLYVRSDHKALNTLLQGAGAIVMKQANINFWKDCKFQCQQVLNIHDEYQIVTNIERDCDMIGKRMVDSIVKAGEDFNLNIMLDGDYKVGKNWADTH